MIPQGARTIWSTPGSRYLNPMREELERALEAKENQSTRRTRVSLNKKKGAEVWRSVRRLKLIQGTARRFVQYKKKTAWRSMKLNIEKTLEFVPKQLMEGLMKKTNRGESQILINRLRNRLSERIIILPEKEYGKFVLGMGYKKKAGIIGLASGDYIFVSEKQLKHGGVNNTFIHETIHLIDHLVGVSRKQTDVEVLSNAISYFIESEVSQKRRLHVLAKVSRPYSNKYLGKEYIEGTNRGIEVFFKAQKLGQEKGRKAAIAFIQDLFLSTTLSYNAIINAEAEARRNY
ncbi:MAG: hypothetical protein WC462_03170 [archaeon]